MDAQNELKVRITIKLYQMDCNGIRAAFKGIENADEVPVRMHVRGSEQVRMFIQETMNSLTLEELQRVDKNIETFKRKKEETATRMAENDRKRLNSRPLELTVDELCKILEEKDVPAEKVEELRRTYENIRSAQMYQKGR